MHCLFCKTKVFMSANIHPDKPVNPNNYKLILIIVIYYIFVYLFLVYSQEIVILNVDNCVLWQIEDPSMTEYLIILIKKGEYSLALSGKCTVSIPLIAATKTDCWKKQHGN